MKKQVILLVLLLAIMTAGCQQKSENSAKETVNLESDAVKIEIASDELDVDISPLIFDGVQSIPQKLTEDEYTYMWWPDGLKNNHVLYFATGCYGAAWDVETLQLTHLEWIESQGKEQTASASNDIVSELAETETRIEIDGNVVSGNGTSAIMYSGPFVQKAAVYGIQAGTEIKVDMSVMATPYYLIVSLQQVEGKPAALTFSQHFLSEYDKVDCHQNQYAVTLADADGKGITVYSQNDIAAKEEGTVTVSGTGELLVIFFPRKNVSDGDLETYTDCQNVLVQYDYVNRNAERSSAQTANFEVKEGHWVIPMAPAQALNYDKPSDRAVCKKTEFTISNPTDKEVRVPIRFTNGNQSIADVTGGAPIIRDLDGCPIGLLVQVSKDWHGSQQWIEYITAVRVPPHSTVGYELTVPTAQYGSAFTASTGQLCLYGYSGVDNQLWIQSALGCFGENITFDPDVNLGRSFINDVRPFQVKKTDLWTWTGNIGGADFLKYSEAKNVRSCIKRVKSTFYSYGPCLTDVQYNGLSFDEKIQCEIETYLGRTDDVPRNYFRMSYTFNEDVTFNRLGVFQMSADGYNDNSFQRFAWGIGNEILEDTEKTKQGRIIEANQAGDLWCFAYDSCDLPEENGNVMFIVRDYEFINGATGEVIRNPTLQLRGYQNKFELTLPASILETGVVPMGSTLNVVIEFLSLPADREAYYGEADYLLAMSQSEMNSTDMAIIQAVQGQLRVEALSGTVVSVYPIQIDASDQTAQIILEGGLGYTPITFMNLDRYDCWELQTSRDGVNWEKIDQSSAKYYAGTDKTDYWQCQYDVATDSYALTYNISNEGGTNYYRLVSTQS